MFVRLSENLLKKCISVDLTSVSTNTVFRFHTQLDEHIQQTRVWPRIKAPTSSICFQTVIFGFSIVVFLSVHVLVNSKSVSNFTHVPGTDE